MNGRGGVEGSAQAIAQAISEASNRFFALLHEEVELAKGEVGQKLSSLLRGTFVGLAAGIFVLAALQMALFGLALLAWYLLPVGELQYFWGFFVVAGGLLFLALLAGVLAWRAVRRGSPPLPTMAVEEARKLRETVAGEGPAIPGWEPVGQGADGEQNAS